MKLRDIFIDKNGNRVIAQKPNPPIIIWAGCLVAARLINDQDLAKYVSNIGTIALSIWALAEIIRGVNTFRRILGTIVLLFILTSLVA